MGARKWYGEQVFCIIAVTTKCILGWLEHYWPIGRQDQNNLFYEHKHELHYKSIHIFKLNVTCVQNYILHVPKGNAGIYFLNIQKQSTKNRVGSSRLADPTVTGVTQMPGLLYQTCVQLLSRRQAVNKALLGFEKVWEVGTECVFVCVCMSVHSPLTTVALLFKRFRLADSWGWELTQRIPSESGWGDF